MSGPHLAIDAMGGDIGPAATVAGAAAALSRSAAARASAVI